MDHSSSIITRVTRDVEKESATRVAEEEEEEEDEGEGEHVEKFS